MMAYQMERIVRKVYAKVHLMVSVVVNNVIVETWMKKVKMGVVMEVHLVMRMSMKEPIVLVAMKEPMVVFLLVIDHRLMAMVGQKMKEENCMVSD